MPDFYDVCVIGGGPSGHSAALYTSRSMLKTILFEGIDNPGGQLTQTTDVENYLGFPEGISGYDLCLKFKEQSERWGTNVINEYVERIVYDDNNDGYKFNVYYDDFNKYISTKTVIICTGSCSKKLIFDGSDTFWNRGITSCAVCHGALPMFRNKPLFIIGGGDTAMEDALYLSRYTNEVYIVHRRDSFRASKVMQQRVFKNNNIKILWNTEIVKAYKKNNDENNENLDTVVLKNNIDEKITEYNSGGVFYAIGHSPSTYFLKNSKINIDLDEDGYIITKPDSTQTNILGIFCAGDVRQSDKKFKQAIVAAGTGCKAALECIDFIENK